MALELFPGLDQTMGDEIVGDVRAKMSGHLCVTEGIMPPKKVADRAPAIARSGV